MGAIMLGWSHKIEDRTNFDIRYRLAVFDAGTSVWNTDGGGWVKTDSGFVKDNSLSVGIRYSF